MDFVLEPLREALSSWLQRRGGEGFFLQEEDFSFSSSLLYLERVGFSQKYRFCFGVPEECLFLSYHISPGIFGVNRFNVDCLIIFATA